MGKKVALLVGVSKYQPGLNPLPSATRDVKALKQVLHHPEIGGFAQADVSPLFNPTRQKMEEEIFSLFANRCPDDLVLFYFSGHGIKDESGNLYIATPATRKDEKGKLILPTAVAASYVREQINNSRSKRQVVILDCCFSGAFAKGLTAKGSVDITNQLGGKGRAILTSSSSLQSSFAGEGSELSIYTRYLVEGMKTGAGDLDNDGWVSVEELHQYASNKVQEASPSMSPELYPVKEGYKIFLAKSPKDDPKLKYRKEVEKVARQEERKITSVNRIYEGKISDNFNRNYLDTLQKSLNLAEEDARAIETEVLEPYRLRQEKLNRYGQLYAEAIKREYPLSQDNREKLKVLQQVLNLRNEDIEPIEKRIAAKLKRSSRSTPRNPNELGATATPTLQSNPPKASEPSSLPKPEPKPEVVTQLSTKGNIGVTVKGRGTRGSRKAGSSSTSLPASTPHSISRSSQQDPPLRPNPTQNQLPSEKGVDYTRLRDLLVAEKWKEADEETARVMLKAADREYIGWLNDNDIKKFPGTDLRTIDHLWVKCSGGRFGFSVQKRIYNEVGKKYEKLGDRVGWRSSGNWLHWRDLTFNDKAPEGHLPGGTSPLGKVDGLIWDGCYVVASLLSRQDLKV